MGRLKEISVYTFLACLATAMIIYEY